MLLRKGSLTHGSCCVCHLFRTVHASCAGSMGPAKYAETGELHEHLPSQCLAFLRPLHALNCMHTQHAITTQRAGASPLLPHPTPPTSSTHVFGALTRASNTSVGPMSSRQAAIAPFLASTTAMMGPLVMNSTRPG